VNEYLEKANFWLSFAGHLSRERLTALVQLLPANEQLLFYRSLGTDLRAAGLL